MTNWIEPDSLHIQLIHGQFITQIMWITTYQYLMVMLKEGML